MIVKDGKFLVIKQRFQGKEYLDLPGGRIEYGLSPQENLIKEIKEEVYLDVKIEKIIGTWYFFRSDGDQVVCITYHCKPLTEEIDINQNPDEEENIFRYRWVTPEEFLKMESDDFDGLETLRGLIKNYFNL